MVSCSTPGSTDTAPAVTPAPHPITTTDFALFGTRVVRCPSIRWSRMSCGSPARLNIAPVVIVPDAVTALGHGDGGVPALADVDDLGLADLGGCIPAERHEHAR